MAANNTAPDTRPQRWAGFEVNDQLVGQDYSLAPGHVGSYDENGNFIPSKFDFTGFAPSNRDLVYGANPSDYEGYGYALSKPNGETVMYNPGNDTVTKYAPAYSTYTNIGQNQWGAFASPNIDKTYNFQGQTVPVLTDPVKYNPATKSLYLEGGSEGLSPAGGNPIQARMGMDSGGGFADFLIENGWIAPLALAGGAAAVEFLPALAGEVGAGAGAGDVFAGYSATGSAAGTAGSTVGAGYGAGATGGLIGSELAGPTYGELGVTGVEGGMAGPTYGELGYTGLNNAEAIAAADAAAQTGLSASDALINANRLKNIAKLLTGSSTSKIYNKNTPTAQQWQQQAGQNLAQATPQQFGGLYEMNKNPFTFQNPLANALSANKPTGLDVSGTGGTALNTTAQASNLAKLLA